MWKQTSDSCNRLTTVTLWMWNTHSSLFCFTSRLFATLCYRPVTLPAGGRRRQDGAMRAIKDQHRQRASLVSTDGAKVGESFNAAKENGLGWKEVKEKVKVSPFFTPFWPFWWKFGESWWKFGESLVKTFVRIRQEGGGLLKRVHWSLPKKQDATPAPPALDPQTAHQRDIDSQGIIQSGHYVIMSSCR